MGMRWRRTYVGVVPVLVAAMLEWRTWPGGAATRWCGLTPTPSELPSFHPWRSLCSAPNEQLGVEEEEKESWMAIRCEMAFWRSPLHIIV